MTQVAKHWPLKITSAITHKMTGNLNHDILIPW